MLRWMIAFFAVFSLFGGESVISGPKLASDAQAIVDQFMKSKEMIRSDADTKIKKELDRLSESLNQLVIQRINDGKIQEANTMRSALKTLLEENTDLFGRAISTERESKTESVAAIMKVDENLPDGEIEIDVILGGTTPIIGRLINDQVLCFGTTFPSKRDSGINTPEHRHHGSEIPVGKPYILLPLIVAPRKVAFSKWQVLPYTRIPKKERDGLNEQQKAFAQGIETAVNAYVGAKSAIEKYNTEIKSIEIAQEKCKENRRKFEDEYRKGSEKNAEKIRTLRDDNRQEERKIEDKRIELRKLSYDTLIKDRQEAFNAVQSLMGQIIASKPSLSTENEAFRSGAKKP